MIIFSFLFKRGGNGRFFRGRISKGNGKVLKKVRRGGKQRSDYLDQAEAFIEDARGADGKAAAKLYGKASEIYQGLAEHGGGNTQNDYLLAYQTAEKAAQAHPSYADKNRARLADLKSRASLKGSSQ